MQLLDKLLSFQGLVAALAALAGFIAIVWFFLRFSQRSATAEGSLPAGSEESASTTAGSPRLTSAEARSRLLRRVVLAVSMAVLAIGVSHVTQHSIMERVVTTERAMLYGQPIVSNGQVLYPLYNRILFPAILESATKVLPTVKDADIFVALRFVSFALSFLLLFSAIEVRAAASGTNATATCLVIGISFIATLVRHPMPSSSDILDLLIMFYVFLNIMEKRVGVAFLLACLTAINRESGAFAGVFYFLLRAGTERPARLVAVSAALTVVPYLLALGVRRAIYQHEFASAGLGQWWVGLQFNLVDMLVDISRFNPANDFGLLLAFLALPSVMLWDRTSLPNGIRTRIILACAAIFLITMQFGIAREIRVFIPCVALLIAATVANFTAPAPRHAGVA